MSIHFSPKNVVALLKQTAVEWMEDNALRLSAALAYYSIFSIAPLLVIAIAIAGWVLGPEAAQGLLAEQLRGLLGHAAAEGVQGMVQSASKPSSSAVASVLGALALLFGASGVFGQLKDALNTIWEVRAKRGQGAMKFVRERLLSFGMVLVIGFLLLTSLVLTTTLTAAAKYVGSALPIPGLLLTGVNFLLSLAMVTVLFAAIFKVLPDAKVPWRDVWIGAAVTAVLFEIGKLLLGLYLGREGAASAYGAAGSIVLVLLWVYYASCILLFGAEFTQVEAQARGAKIEPSANAEAVTAEARAQQGLSPGMRDDGEQPAPRKESPRAVLGITETAPTTDFIEEHAPAVLVASVAGGLVIGLGLRALADRAARSPGEEIRHGTLALLGAGAAAAVASLRRARKTTERKLPKAREQAMTTLNQTRAALEAAAALVRKRARAL